MVIRLGYSLTGRQNHPASPEATGLEVDKLDKDAVRQYINTYLDMYKDATGGLMGSKGLSHMILDSYEAGHMNWTKTLPEEFARRRGYDLKGWVPDISGTLKAGANRVEIKVTNLWVNRLIGDAQPGSKKITFTTMPFYQANAPLMPSGLLGPVVLKQSN